MDVKKITKKLAKVRDNVRENGQLSEEDKKALKTLIIEPLTINQGKFRKPSPHNDNSPLTPEQHFRLKIMEKTGTGSTSIH